MTTTQTVPSPPRAKPKVTAPGRQTTWQKILHMRQSIQTLMDEIDDLERDPESFADVSGANRAQARHKMQTLQADLARCREELIHLLAGSKGIAEKQGQLSGEPLRKGE